MLLNYTIVEVCSVSVSVHYCYRNLNDDIIQQPGPLKVTANIVFGYAT